MDNVSNAGVSLCSMHSAKKHDSLRDACSVTVLLATARVRVVDPRGESHIVRCLIDSGSQNHFITSQCCERLSLTLQQPEFPISVHGFGGGVNRVKGVTELEFTSRFDNGVAFSIRPLVVDNITNDLPTSGVDTSMLSYLSSVPLADDAFHIPGEVEMLIGAQLFAKLLLTGRIHGPPGMPDAIQTSLGFIIMGKVPTLTVSKSSRTATYCTFVESQMQDAVSKFWQLEEVPSSTSASLSREEQECEDIYKSTTTRDASGRYTVALPFKANLTELGSSLSVAQKRFFALERKLQASPPLRKAYDDVMKEYLEFGYLTPILNNDASSGDAGYVIPHHGIVRDDKVTTKLRIVLDASANTDKGRSLNEMLHAGPNLQGDIFTLLLNFRLFAVAFCADVRHMYLQIRVHSHFCKYLQVLYRFNPNDQLQIFQFDRVCFGLTSSPFLALRTIRQLCEDEKNNFPLAARVTQNGLYMDDVIFSEESVSVAREMALQLIGMFKAGGFDLQKWSSNSPGLLCQIPETQLHPHVYNFDDDGQKILGVKWEPRSDTFSFDVAPCADVCTKRNILSAVARLWDVLGFAAPVILYAKLLLRDLWALKIDWDESPPSNVVDKWTWFKTELHMSMKLSILRHSRTPPVMADLPECRLQNTKPFSHTGLDYCGPINITLTRKRGVTSQKAYICDFICLTTRALHVELVPDLGTEAFLNALKRFLGRRGPVDKLFSDNGTNFVGARAYMNELYSFLQDPSHTNQWDSELAHQRIQWQMIPPNAPHFGGGWEATVKSFKTHLLRVIGAQILTYEELLTVLIQIEAVLNSRPLGQALSPDPSEPVALTPAHFLHTVPLRSLPSVPIMDSIDKLRSRFLLIDKLVQSCWSKWSDEYLNTLQAREKWLTDCNPIKGHRGFDYKK